LPRRMDARRGEEDLVPRFFRRHSTPICLADKPRLRRAAKKRLYAEGTRVPFAYGIKVGQLLTCYFLLVRVALIAGFFPFFACINKVLVNPATAGARSGVGDHCLSEALQQGPHQSLPVWRMTLVSPQTLQINSVINHQLQTVPAPIAAIMSGASPCPMLTVRGDEQKESVPAHRSTD